MEKKRGIPVAYEVVGIWPADWQTWEPLHYILKNALGVLEDFLHTSGDRNIKREMLDILF